MNETQVLSAEEQAHVVETFRAHLETLISAIQNGQVHSELIPPDTLRGIAVGRLRALQDLQIDHVESGPLQDRLFGDTEIGNDAQTIKSAGVQVTWDLRSGAVRATYHVNEKGASGEQSTGHQGVVFAITSAIPARPDSAGQFSVSEPMGDLNFHFTFSHPELPAGPIPSPGTIPTAPPT